MSENDDKTRDKAEEWEQLMKSIRRAAKILGKDLSAEWPDYGNWQYARDLWSKLWAQVYNRNKKG